MPLRGSNSPYKEANKDSENKIMRQLQNLEIKANNEGLSKVSYGEICNDPIKSCMPMRVYPKIFEMLKINKFKIKEDPKENLRHFKYTCYMIANDNAIFLGSSQ